MFCMLLRKYCEGGVIENIEQTDRERILRLSVRRRDELGDVSLKTIVVEIMGRHSNIILLDPATQTIHDGIHHVTPAISSYRIIMPGSQYIAPPDQHKADPVHITGQAAFEAAFSAAAKEEPVTADKQLVDAFSGISPLLAKEIAYRSRQTAGTGQHGEEGIETLWLSFNDVMQQVRDGNYTPVIATSPEGKSHFSVTTLTHLNDAEVQTYETISACLEAFYGDKAERDTVKQRANDLIRFVQNEKIKMRKKLKNWRTRWKKRRMRINTECSESF